MEKNVRKKYYFEICDEYDKVLSACVSSAKATGRAQWGNYEKTVINGHNGMNLPLLLNPVDWSVHLIKSSEGCVGITIFTEGFDETCCQYIIDRFVTAFLKCSLVHSEEFIKFASEAAKRKVKLLIRPMIMILCVLIIALFLFGSIELILTVVGISVFVFWIVYACAAAAAGSRAVKKNKNASVVGRGVVGGIIAGPAGAVVGALSAVDKNNKNRK